MKGKELGEVLSGFFKEKDVFLNSDEVSSIRIGLVLGSAFVCTAGDSVKS